MATIETSCKNNLQIRLRVVRHAKFVESKIPHDLLFIYSVGCT